MRKWCVLVQTLDNIDIAYIGDSEEKARKIANSIEKGYVNTHCYVRLYKSEKYDDFK